jgi:hypothetical protein
VTDSASSIPPQSPSSTAYPSDGSPSAESMSYATGGEVVFRNARITRDATNPNNLRITSDNCRHVCKVYGDGPDDARIKAEAVLNALRTASDQTGRGSAGTTNCDTGASTPSGHAIDCDWHCEQVESECTCGRSTGNSGIGGEVEALMQATADLIRSCTRRPVGGGDGGTYFVEAPESSALRKASDAIAALRARSAQ